MNVKIPTSRSNVTNTPNASTLLDPSNAIAKRDTAAKVESSASQSTSARKKRHVESTRIASQPDPENTFANAKKVMWRKTALALISTSAPGKRHAMNWRIARTQLVHTFAGKPSRRINTRIYNACNLCCMFHHTDFIEILIYECE